MTCDITFTYVELRGFPSNSGFLQHVQIFRLLLKISVEENNWLIFRRPVFRRGTQQLQKESYYNTPQLTKYRSQIPQRERFDRETFFPLRQGETIL